MINDDKTISFKGNDPGAARYGNFINYYQFHPAANRINLLPTDIWRYEQNQTYVVLDIGCNAGNLTQELYTFLNQHISCECKIFGIDIDKLLIERALLHNRYNENVVYKCVDIMNEEEKQIFMKESLPKGKLRFNAIFCFSVSMWIHLNHGDEGLSRFLKFLCEVTDMLIIEPQPWKCYKTALRRMKKSNETFQLYDTLKMREDIEKQIEQIITRQYFVKLFETPNTVWGRRIVFFEKTDR